MIRFFLRDSNTTPTKRTPLIRRVGAAALGLALMGAPVGTALLVAGAPAAIAQETLTPEQKMDRMFSAYKEFGGKLSYSGLTEEGGVLTVKDLKITMELPVKDPAKPNAAPVKKTFIITAEEMIIRSYDYSNPDLPAFADGEVKGMRFDGELVQNKEMSQALVAMGLKEIVLDARFKYTSDVKTGTIDLSTYSITLRDVMGFDFAGKIDKIDFTKLPKEMFTMGFAVPGKDGKMKKMPKNAGEMFMAAFGQSRLHSLKISLTDLGGIERGMKFAAEQQSAKNPNGPKMTPQMMRAQAKGMLAFANQKLTGAFAASLIKAAGQLISGPGTITLAAKPAQPVQFVSLFGFAMMTAASAQKPGQKLNLDPVQGFLGLQATFTPASQ